FERNFDERAAVEWMRDHWHRTLFYSVAYLILIFGIQHFMKERAAYKLRLPLMLWSFSLALLSAVGALRIGKQMSFLLSTKGFKQTVCSKSFYVHPVSKLWVYLFVVSKVLELGDTVFIVLRKKKLIFLHWYHHAITMVLGWYSYKDMTAGIGWPAFLNFSVHAMMYSYYTVKAAGFRVPRFISMAVTATQIVQLIGYIIINIFAVYWMDDKVCPFTWTNFFLSFTLFISVLVLFCNYFWKMYLSSTKKSKGE
ncbi:ELOV6 protein, partial [Trogon melanurus]|nr:ELOV6 protein [Trogon melanurus]